LHRRTVKGVPILAPHRSFELATESREKQRDDFRALGVRLVIIHDENGVIRFDGPPIDFPPSTTGALDEPPPNAWLRYKAHFAGSATSPYGIRQVNLLFDNGAVRI